MPRRGVAPKFSGVEVIAEGCIYVKAGGQPISNLHIYDISGRETTSNVDLPNGVYLVRGGNLSTRKVKVMTIKKSLAHVLNKTGFST